jgi:predicted RNA-binding protein with PIN domain
MANAPVVEILFFEGCPNHEGARELVERVAAELGIEPDLRLINVETPDDAQRLRFLGSPTIRVNAHDVEPDADERHDFAQACRVYRTSSGFEGQPDEAWLRDALTATSD